jgi:pentatricopeptide repeat protein
VAAAEWASVLDISAVMKRRNLTQEHSTFRMCFQHCFEVGDGALAIETLRAMDQALIEPKPSDIGLVAAAMCRKNRDEPGSWRKALELLLCRPSPDVPIDAYDAVFGCLVDECNWKESIRLLRRLEQPAESNGTRNLPEPTLSTYREVIECCVGANQVEQAVQMLLSMEKRGIRPTAYTFELVISALAKKLQWRRALQLLDLMDKWGVHKSAQTYNALISACARGKETGIAKNLVSRMKKDGILPSLSTYNSKPYSVDRCSGGPKSQLIRWLLSLAAYVPHGLAPASWCFDVGVAVHSLA